MQPSNALLELIQSEGVGDTVEEITADVLKMSPVSDFVYKQKSNPVLLGKRSGSVTVVESEPHSPVLKDSFDPFASYGKA